MIESSVTPRTVRVGDFLVLDDDAPRITDLLGTPSGGKVAVLAGRPGVHPLPREFHVLRAVTRRAL